LREYWIKAPSAINSKTLPEYLDNELAEAPLALKLMLAPRNSPHCCFEILVVPLPIMVLVMSATLVAFCVMDHCLMLNKRNVVIYGFQQITFKPFFNSKVTGFQFSLGLLRFWLRDDLSLHKYWLRTSLI
jgi:hypothetical protein